MDRRQGTWFKIAAIFKGMEAKLIFAVAAVATGDVMASKAFQLSPPIARGTTSLYPRVVELQPPGGDELLLSLVEFSPNGTGFGALYSSNTYGSSFSQPVGRVVDEDGATGLCCATLYRLPTTIGNLSAGTLLWAGSFSQRATPRQMRIKAHSSTDSGRTWTFLSTIAIAPEGNQGGLWEPELFIDTRGMLNCVYSDETLQDHSQALVLVSSSDGLTWSSKNLVVAASPQQLRPGMANVRRLNGDLFMMTYEVCGGTGTLACGVHYRLGQNGFEWGNTSDLGTLVSDRRRYLAHAPVLAHVSGTSSPLVFLTAQQLLNNDGTAAADSGNVTFSAFGTGDQAFTWTAHSAAVPVANPPNNYCPNYSPGMLARLTASSGTFGDLSVQVTEVTTNYNGTICQAFYGSETLLVPHTSSVRQFE